MHCRNPGCYEDTCNGECDKSKRLSQQARDKERKSKANDWPWYSYEPEESGVPSNSEG
jgi:hypothetical protein